MELLDWQKRLDEHFQALRSRRTAEVGDQPIFALEHGLAEDELDSVADSIRTHIARGRPSSEHQLPWTVYSSEIGYLYAGDEYWQTFEEKTPGWEEHGDRHWIRRCFRGFHEQYGGAMPSGPWAQHFSIICWPITHAILPRDLQRQLAKILFEARHSLTSEALDSPRRLGEIIASRSWNASSRFQQLAQEPVLIGQIAAALLLKGEERASSLILDATLTRIGKDLDRERRARTWMRGARDAARQKNRFATIPGLGSRAERPTSDDDRDAALAVLGLEPRLLIRPVGSNEWDVFLELPDFSHLPARFPETREPLLNSRCRVRGSSGRPLARGRLLHGVQRVKLDLWPKGDEALIKFEPTSRRLDYLLGAECFVTSGPIWLFRVAADGAAYELKRAQVRAGQDYVVVANDERLEAIRPFGQSIRVNCEGAGAVLLEMPDQVSADLSAALDDVGIPQAKNVRVWPSGLVPSKWDGAGIAEWLSTDTPCIGVQADHPVRAYSFRLGTQALEVLANASADPVFVEFPGLGVGRHELSVAAVEEGAAVVEPATLEIRVREPSGRTPGQGSQGAFLVVTDPSVPTLDEFWADRVDLEIHGPRGLQVGCTVALSQKGEAQPVFAKRLPPLRIPVKDRSWHDYFQRNFRKDGKLQAAYDLAQSCELCFDAAGVGRSVVSLERSFTPLRWARLRSKGSDRLRILDDSGASASLELRFYSLDRPADAEELDAGSYASAPGGDVGAGLFVASSNGHNAAILIPQEVKTLSDLRIAPTVGAPPRSTAGVVDLVRLAGLWGQARMTGSISSYASQRQVLASIGGVLFSLIAGPRWAQIEESFAQGQRAEAVREAKRATAKTRDADVLVAALTEELEAIAVLEPDQRVERFAGLAKGLVRLDAGPGEETRIGERGGQAVIRRRRDAPDRAGWLAEFALRLASAPETLECWAADDLETGVQKVLENPFLARAARFLVIALESVPDRPRETRWDWP